MRGPRCDERSPASQRHSAQEHPEARPDKGMHGLMRIAALPRRHYFRSAHGRADEYYRNVLPLATGVYDGHLSRQSSSFEHYTQTGLRGPWPELRRRSAVPSRTTRPKQPPHAGIYWPHCRSMCRDPRPSLFSARWGLYRRLPRHRIRYSQRSPESAC